MVSTRGVRYKFSEGERVLCYEPDPTKAKVLYDSKVLEVIESKDKRGRRTVEYLIHFQGWNSSWDRCVSEDFVLKDTEENRQLQRDLAEKSQLQLGAYLYRRERKKGSSSSNTGGGPAKRARHGFSDDGSSSSTTQPDEPEVVDTDSSSGGSGSRPHSPPPQPGRASIPLTSKLRDRLTFDYHLVVKRGKINRLPAVPTAAFILESFVRWFARAGAWHPQRGRHDPPQRPDLTDVSCRLNLIREVADGIRVYFDFILRGHLLYKQEHFQYHVFCGRHLEKLEQEEALRQAANKDVFAFDSEDKTTQVLSPPFPDYAHLPPFNKEAEEKDVFDFDAETEGKIPDDILSPTASFPLPPSLPPPMFPKHLHFKEKQSAKNDILFNSLLEPPRMETNDKPATVVSDSRPDPMPDDPPNNVATKLSNIRSAPRSGAVARRLRSHKSAVSQSEEEPTPSTSILEPRTLETLSSSVGSSGSSLSESWSRPTHAQSKPAAPHSTRTPLSLLFDKVSSWEIIPANSKEPLPCLVYGATHLARLFVKLPDFLNATQMPDYKLKLILKHIDLFVQYLDEHHEWFGEPMYMNIEDLKLEDGDIVVNAVDVDARPEER